MTFGAKNSPTSIIAHLVPLGTPVPLISFMVVVEIIRNIIRPLTLRVRLAANMIAGHLLLSLLGSQAPGSSVAVIFLIIIAITLLLVLETRVSLIQAYVFSVLSTLYFNEINTPDFE